jgi:hypothetical protein
LSLETKRTEDARRTSTADSDRHPPPEVERRKPAVAEPRTPLKKLLDDNSLDEVRPKSPERFGNII